jgi:hypothetical protein
VLAVVVWVGRERIKQLSHALGTAQQEMEESKRQTESDLARVNRSAVAQAATVQQDLRRGLLVSHQVLASNMTVQLENRDVEVDRLKEKLSALEIENAMLVGQLKELAETTRQLQESLVAAPESAPAPVEPVVTNRPPPMLINSPGYGRPVQLRIPLVP